MPTIQEIRQQYPQYNDLSDGQLADSLHSKFYSDMDKGSFNDKIGLAAKPTEETLGGALKSAITDIPAEATRETSNQAASAYSGLISHDQDPRPAHWYDIGAAAQGVLNTGKGFLSALTIPAAPIIGAAKSLFGHPLAYADQQADKINPNNVPGEGFTPAQGQSYYDAAKDRVGVALSAAAPVKGYIPPVSAPAPASELVQAAQAEGIPLSRAAASENQSVQRVAQSIGDAPFVGSPVRQSVGETFNALQARKDALRQDLGGLTPESAGNKIISGIGDYNTDLFERRASAPYDRVQELIDPVLRQYPIDPATGQPSNRLKAISDLNGEYSNANLDGQAAVDKKYVDAAQNGVGLNYQGMKDLRTKIGRSQAATQDPNKIEDLGQIYGGVSKDMRNLAEASGGQDAIRKQQLADKFYTLAKDRQADLQSVLGRDRAPEKVFNSVYNMGIEGGSADAGKLAKVRKAFGEDNWKEVSSAFVGKLFDEPQFVSKYGKMSEAGKNILFGDAKPSIDRIHMISERMAQFEKLKNHSNTFSNASFWKGIAAGAAEFGITGGIPWTTLSLGAGSRVAAQLLSRSATAKPAASWATALESFAKNPMQRNSLAVLNAASQSLAKAAQSAGITFDANKLFQASQGMNPAAADEQNQP